jgi:chromosome-anchoring protein RacA
VVKVNSTTVAAKVGISTKTLRKWIKMFDLECSKNEHGHYVFDEKDYSVFCEIRDNLKKGVPTHEILIKTPRRGIVKDMNKTGDHPLQQQFEVLLERMERNEQKIEQKASEVVSYQLLQHRREIEELNERVAKLETYIQQLEKEKKDKNKKQEHILSLQQQTPKIVKPKRRKIASFFF